MPATVYLPGKKHKYGAKRTNGYDSRKEANRAARRCVSVEPMLGPINLRPIKCKDFKYVIDRPASLYALEGCYQIPDCHYSEPLPKLDWVICGGQTGPGAQPLHPDWVRSLRDQCKASGVPFFLKSMHIDGRIVKMPELDGKVWNEFPTIKNDAL
jgi:protein gp37